MAGSNELTRHLWEIVQDNNTTTKEKTNVLSCLMQLYNKPPSNTYFWARIIHEYQEKSI